MYCEVTVIYNELAILYGSGNVIRYTGNVVRYAGVLFSTVFCTLCICCEALGIIVYVS